MEIQKPRYLDRGRHERKPFTPIRSFRREPPKEEPKEPPPEEVVPEESEPIREPDIEPSEEKVSRGRPKGVLNRRSPTNVKWAKGVAKEEGIITVREDAIETLNDKSDATLRAGCHRCKKDPHSKSLRGYHL